MAIEKGTILSALWWQDVGWTFCDEWDEENADKQGLGIDKPGANKQNKITRIEGKNPSLRAR